MRVYLDTGVYNRPFDDQTQPRIWLESLAFSVILQMIESGELELITSTVVAYETGRNPFAQRREWVERVGQLALHHQLVDDTIRLRALNLEQKGLKALDALHVACAEAAGVDYFITVDDRLIRRHHALSNQVMIAIDPTSFVREVAGQNLG